MIDGTNGNDTLVGGAAEADYMIRGGSGNDLITGSNRANFAVYVGKYSEYTITTSAGVITVTDKLPSGTARTVSDGVDTLKGVNLLRFSDRDYFVTTAANKVSLPGSDQIYRVANSEWVLGNTAAKETFVIKPKTSALIAAALDDVVELSAAASAYTYKAVLAQLQISDGTYTTFINVGGTFTLRTASGSTTVAYVGGKIQLGGTQNVGDATFSVASAITDTSKVSTSVAANSAVAPTVVPVQSSVTTPTVTGTAAVGVDQSLAVVVNGVTYTKASGLSFGSGNTWSLTIPDANKLNLGQSYEVRAELRPASVTAASVVAGTSGADVLSNTVGTPTLFTGGAGNDTITGGNRADVASYSGKYSDYTITTNAGVITVTDKLPSGTTRTVSDGADTLKGLNVLHFSDRDYFVTTAANKVSLPGGDQTYQVSNSEWVLGNTAAVETFVVAPKTSALLAVAKDDVVDLSRAIDAYTYKAVLAQLQISDGTFTTFINVGGNFTLRTASGSTSVAYTSGKVQLGGTQNVGDPTFSAAAAITDRTKLSSNALLNLVDSTSNELTLTSQSALNVIKVSNNYLEVASNWAALAKLVPTATSAGLVFDVQLDSAVGQFDAMNIDLSFNASKLTYNDATTSIKGTWDLQSQGLATVDSSNMVSLGAATLTPFNPTQTHSVANLGFTWASGVTGPTSADSMHWHIYLTRGAANVQTVLDVSQDISFKAATTNGGTAAGTSGADQFIIGGGNVAVTGGLGADQFVLTSSQVNLTIQDFTSGVDKLDLGRLISSLGYSSASTDASASNLTGQLIPLASGAAVPTSAQIANHDLALDNKSWFSYDSATHKLDLFADQATSVSQVDIVKMTIQFGSASTGIAATDFLLTPYTSGAVI